MTATMHKLTAGDGYMYLIRQVAAHDATARGRDTLADYYSSKGESPGLWMGSGLPTLRTIGAGDEVTEAHMLALFGEGKHPDATAIEGRHATALVA
ncbi:MAG: relaxase domain-containing protein, partial [Rhodococcus sp. (in: high G+C Gram-positive bacteria)]